MTHPINDNRDPTTQSPSPIGETETEKCPFLLAYSDGSDAERIESTPEAITAYICSHGLDGDITITDHMDRFVLDTFGLYINRCPDQDLLKGALLPVLIPAQIEAERKAFGMSAMDL